MVLHVMQDLQLRASDTLCVAHNWLTITVVKLAPDDACRQDFFLRSRRREEADCCAHIELRLPTNGSGARTSLSAAACSVQLAPASRSVTQFASCCGQECPMPLGFGSKE